MDLVTAISSVLLVSPANIYSSFTALSAKIISSTKAYSTGAADYYTGLTYPKR